MALGERGREHVPYRSSKLTHVLRDSLGGNCATTLVANVWADPAQLEETLSTCRFAQRMTRVTCEITANVVQDSSGRVSPSVSGCCAPWLRAACCLLGGFLRAA